jgi:hypothetical protein
VRHEFRVRQDEVVPGQDESSTTWVWMWSSAEIVALDSFGVGDVVQWSCRQHTHVPVDLPPDVARETLLIEDSDYSLGTDDDFVDASGQVASIGAAHDQWRRAEGGWWEATPGTRTWSETDRTLVGTHVPPRGGASGYLVELVPTTGSTHAGR